MMILGIMSFFGWFIGTSISRNEVQLIHR